MKHGRSDINNVDKEELEQDEEKILDLNNLPKNSILFKEDNTNNNEEEEIFKSVLFTEMVKEHKNLIQRKKEQNENLKLKLTSLMKCGSCSKQLKDLFYCPYCKKNSCKNCFNKHYYYLKKDYTPCPLCKKMVKKANLKPITLLKAIAEIVEEDEEDNSTIKFNSNQLISNCENHKLNKIWAYCIDCDKKMCPVCYTAQIIIHKEHRCVNYEKYLDLNIFFGNSFKNIKEFILETDKTIRELQQLNSDLENHKSALLNFSNDICYKIDLLYQEGQNKIDEIISSLTQKISEFNNFRRNIKKYVTKLIPKGYSEFDNMEEIKNEIQKRIGNLKIEFPKDDQVSKIEKNYKKDIKFQKLEEKININKSRIKRGIKTNVQYNDNYIFNIELSDNEDVFFYLNINRFLNGKNNNNSYLVRVTFSDLEYNSKIIYLEQDIDNVSDENDNKNVITFINSIPLKKLFNNCKSGTINLRIDYLDME